MEVDAQNGRALQRPQNRYVVLEGGGALSWYADAARTTLVRKQALVGGRCSVPVSGSSGSLPVVRSGKVQPEATPMTAVLPA